MFTDIEKIVRFLTYEIAKGKILVIGDVMLDRYYFGEVERISPEAPVPVVKVSRISETLGGAGNVVNNLARLHCKTLLVGVTGDDRSRGHICKLMQDENIDYSGLIVTNRPTITKTRVIGEHQQMVRLDFEEIRPLDGKEVNTLRQWISSRIEEGVGAVVVSDYGKGICTDEFCHFIITKCREFHVPVIVDPKAKDWSKYSGANFIAPNVKELSEAVSLKLKNVDEEIVKHGVRVRKKFRIDNLIVTRSERGITMINNNGVTHVPTRVQEVFDVSGAGDTVVATLAALISGGIDVLDAVKVANIAAGVVVGKVGTYAINTEDLLEALHDLDGDFGFNRKIKSLTEIMECVTKWRNMGQKIIFTDGYFDVLSSEYVFYLGKAKKSGDRLIVGLCADSSNRRSKDVIKPMKKVKDRATMYAALEFVDSVLLYDSNNLDKVLCTLKPDILLQKG